MVSWVTGSGAVLEKDFKEYFGFSLFNGLALLGLDNIVKLYDGRLWVVFQTLEHVRVLGTDDLFRGLIVDDSNSNKVLRIVLIHLKKRIGLIYTYFP